MDLGSKPTYYVNLAGVNSTVYDFALFFGRRKDRERAEGENIENDVDVCVMMSPQHAKAFAKLLNEAVEGYEEAFGNIELNAKVDGNENKE